MEIPNGPIKIGFSHNPKSRVKDFTLPWPAKIIGIVEGSPSNEKWIHQNLAVHRMQREWFQPAPEVLNLIEKVSLEGWTWPELTRPVPSPRQLKAIRAWLGLNQLEFGERCGVSLATINNFEGEIVKTSTDSLIAITRYLDEVGIEIGLDGNLLLPQ